jgi:prepilin signal peptidase PulO-like enzyme (type II secretory pathway)
VLNLSLEIRAGLIFVLSLIVAGQINRAIYRLAWSPRQIGPWSAPHPAVPARHWSDRIPVWGWFGMERESKVHGSWFWLRPMVIELLFAAGLAALYMWECEGGLAPAAKLVESTIHWQFFSHAVLLTLMTVATFIDLDEKTIPDAITIPGTVFALVMATLVPRSMLPAADGQRMLLSNPHDWPAVLDGPQGLAFGLAVIAAWCYALFPKTLTMRYGLWRAIKYLVVSVVRHPLTWLLTGMGLVLSVGVYFTWSHGGESWQSLLTALAGLAFGGFIIWGIRVSAGLAMGVEAMGFGDVTLLAMVGAFLGWQAALLVFLISPFAGAVIALLQRLISGEREIAYGPFLCTGALVVLLWWPFMWDRWGFVFIFGKWIPVGCFVCFIPMALMLFSWRWFTDRRFPTDDR